MSSNATMPRITIVTPSYNQASYLGAAIESILDQNYPNLEYFVVDGGSTDESVKVIQKYARHLTWWTSERDSGQSEAIEKGFARATGVIGNWINSDDLLFPGALNTIAREYVAHPDAGLYAGDQAYGDIEGRVYKVVAAPSSLGIDPGAWVIPIGQQSTFFSMDAYRTVGGVRRDLHAIMDQELYYRILVRGHRVHRIHSVLGMIRTHPEAKTESRQDLWDAEIPTFLSAAGISARDRSIGLFRTRLGRVADGTYARSLRLRRKWRNRHPWKQV